MIADAIALGAVVLLAVAFGVRAYRDMKWRREYERWRDRYPPDR